MEDCLDRGGVPRVQNAAAAVVGGGIAWLDAERASTRPSVGHNCLRSENLNRYRSEREGEDQSK